MKACAADMFIMVIKESASFRLKLLIELEIHLYTAFYNSIYMSVVDERNTIYITLKNPKTQATANLTIKTENHIEEVKSDLLAYFKTKG